MRAIRDSVDRIAAPLLYVIVAAYAIHASIVTPFHNWDVIAYIAAAKSFEQPDVAALQSFTYRELRDVVPEAVYEEYAQQTDAGNSARTRYRHAVSTDPGAFAEMLPFYRVRPVYNGLIYLMYKSGVDIEFATHLISGIAVALALLILYRIASSFLLRPFVYALPALAVLFGVLGLARYSTPDGLSLLTAVVVVLLFLRGRVDVAMFVAPLAIGVRSDLILFTLPLLLWLLVFGNVARWKPALSVAASVLVYFTIVHCAGNPGWSTFFYCSAVERCLHPISEPPVLQTATYFQVLASGSRALAADPLFDGYAAMLCAVCMLAWSMFRRPALRARTTTFCALTLVCLAYAIGRFLVLPAEWGRFFTMPYLFTAFSLLALLSLCLRQVDWRGVAVRAAN